MNVFAASPASDSLPAEEAKGMKFAMGGHAANGHAIGGHGEAGGHGEGSAGTGGDPAHPVVGTQPMGHGAAGNKHWQQELRPLAATEGGLDLSVNVFNQIDTNGQGYAQDTLLSTTSCELWRLVEELLLGDGDGDGGGGDGPTNKYTVAVAPVVVNERTK
ncbi:hypothetical protein AKJ16_DCAP14303 [Drosera capensis]